MSHRTALYIRLLLGLLLLPLLGRSDEPNRESCNSDAPSSLGQSNCPLPAAGSPKDNEGDARLRGKVIKIECGAFSSAGQEYIAVIKPTKVFRGELGSPIEVRFGLGPKPFFFAKGDEVELILTRRQNSWTVASPTHRRILTASGNALPTCQPSTAVRK
jgi:hypothetical protein